MNIFSITLIWLVLLLSAGPAAGEVVDRIVAQINQEIITMSELEQAVKYLQANTPPGMNPKDPVTFRRQTLEALIDRKLAKEEAKRLGITVSEKEINQSLEDIRRRNGFADNEAMAKALAKEGMTLEQFRQYLAEQIQQERLMQLTLRGKVKVSEEEIRRFYEQNYRASDNRLHIKVLNLPFPPGATAAQQEEVREQAEKILMAAKQGESFDKLLREHNKPAGGMPSGDLGFIRQGDMDPRFFEFLARLRPGEVVPLKTSAGFQIIQLVEARIGKAKSLEEARPEIEQILERAEMNKLFSEYLRSARQRALVKVML